MYNYILGSVVEIDTNYIVIDNNGIGYNVYVANPYIYREGEQYKVYTYQHITEYDQTLYGFSSRDEKELFLRLINVKGLGPKVALPMFAGSSVEGIIDAIDRENVIYLTKFPKVGEKLARQIILDLKGKLAPKEDNGFKLFGKDYQHCSHEELKIIYDGLQDENYQIYEGKGQINHININESYAKEVASSISVGEHHLRVVVDCGNGTASSIIRSVYDRLPFDVTYLFCDSNPNFPNHHPDPNVKSNLAKLSKAVKHNRADIGLAYDGDCDRCGFVDNKGNIIDADIMMAVMCRAIIKNSSNKMILMDIKSSNALKDAIESAGGEVFLDTSSSAQEERSIFENNIPFG